MSKKVYVKVDKEIEPGDLVRCVQYDGHEAGEVRKVQDVQRDKFSLLGCWGSHEKSLWQPVHKLQIGDQVLWHGEGPYIVDAFPDDLEDYSVHVSHPDDEDDCGYVTEYDLELYQPEKHKPELAPDPNIIQRLPGPREFSISINPVDKDKFLADLRNMSCRQDMRTAVAEMIVELLDKAPTKRYVSLHAHPRYGRVHAIDNSNVCEARLAPNDTWDTLTGVYVALCKATGRELPEWIYGGNYEQ